MACDLEAVLLPWERLTNCPHRGWNTGGGQDTPSSSSGQGTLAPVILIGSPSLITASFLNVDQFYICFWLLVKVFSQKYGLIIFIFLTLSASFAASKIMRTIFGIHRNQNQAYNSALNIPRIQKNYYSGDLDLINFNERRFTYMKREAVLHNVSVKV